MAEIRAIQKQNEENIRKLEKNIDKMASAHSEEAAEIWLLMGKVAKGTEAAQKETRELRESIRELTADQKRTEAVLRSFIQSLRGANGHRKRGIS